MLTINHSEQTQLISNVLMEDGVGDSDEDDQVVSFEASISDGTNSRSARGIQCSTGPFLCPDDEITSREDVMDVDATPSETNNNGKELDGLVRRLSYHVFRLVGFDADLDRILVNGRLRLQSKNGSKSGRQDNLSPREIESLNLLCNLIRPLHGEIPSMTEKRARWMSERMKAFAMAGKGADVNKAKNNIMAILFSLGDITESQKDELAEKTSRGFQSDLGAMLCPVDLDWDDSKIRKKIRNGQIKVTSDHFPRFLYKKYKCDPNDYDKGLLKNSALLRVGKLIFTGRLSAFMAGPSSNLTRTNAGLANVHKVTPRMIAYSACIHRFAISDADVWTSMDKDFDMYQFYWNIVGIIDGSETTEKILRWWNKKLFDTQYGEVSNKRSPGTLDLLRDQRRAKRSRGP